MNFQRALDAKAMQWEREAIVAIADCILEDKVAAVRYFETTTGKGLAVEVESTEVCYISSARQFPYRWSCLVENYDRAVRGIGFRNVPPLPEDPDDAFEAQISELCKRNPYM